MADHKEPPSALPTEENIGRWQQAISDMTMETQDTILQLGKLTQTVVQHKDLTDDEREAVVWSLFGILQSVTEGYVSPDIFQPEPAPADVPNSNDESESDVEMEDGPSKRRERGMGNFIQDQVEPEADSAVPVSVWEQTLIQKGLRHGNGKPGNPPMFVGGKSDGPPPEIKVPSIALSADCGPERLSQVIDILTVALGALKWPASEKMQPVVKQLHPFAVIKLVALVTEEALGTKGLAKFNQILKAAGGTSKEGITHLDVSTAQELAKQTGIPQVEKAFYQQLSQVFEAGMKKDAFTSFKGLIAKIILVENFIKMVEAVERDPKGVMAKRLDRLVERKRGNKIVDRVMTYTVKSLEWPEEDTKKFKTLMTSAKPLWHMARKWGLGFMLLINPDTILSTINKTSHSVMPFFADIVNREFPEFRVLSKKLEHHVVMPLCATDREAFIRVAGKSVSTGKVGQDMTSRIMTQFPHNFTLQ